MKIFKAGTLRGTTSNARLSAANDLVQRTLAQHGLSSDLPSMPSLNTVLGKAATPHIDIPTGATFENDTFTCQVGSRAYRSYVPASAKNGVTGVVIMLHGCTQNPTDFATGTGMNTLAEKHRFVVIYPAQSRGDNAQSCWNWFSRGDQRRGKGEPAIIAGLTQKICAKFNITKEHTFVAGLSAGAAMAVILGETYADVFGAIGAHSGLPYGAANDVPSAFAAMSGGALGSLPRPSTTAMRTIVFHGTADTIVNPANGDTIARNALAASQTTETTKSCNIAGRSVTRTQSTTFDGIPTLEHWSINGLGHAWSGGKAGGSYTDPKGPDASAEMVRFFFDITDKAL